MTLKEYMRLQSLSTEIYGLAVLDTPQRITDSEITDLKELLIPNGRVFATNRRHLEFIDLSAKFMHAIREGRVLTTAWEHEGRQHGEVEILAPVK